MLYSYWGAAAVEEQCFTWATAWEMGIMLVGLNHFKIRLNKYSYSLREFGNRTPELFDGFVSHTVSGLNYFSEQVVVLDNSVFKNDFGVIEVVF